MQCFRAAASLFHTEWIHSRVQTAFTISRESLHWVPGESVLVTFLGYSFSSLEIHFQSIRTVLVHLLNWILRLYSSFLLVSFPFVHELSPPLGLCKTSHSDISLFSTWLSFCSAFLTHLFYFSLLKYWLQEQQQQQQQSCTFFGQSIFF